MERGNTRKEILEASLELFSVQGFEATLAQLARRVHKAQRVIPAMLDRRANRDRRVSRESRDLPVLLVLTVRVPMHLQRTAFSRFQS